MPTQSRATIRFIPPHQHIPPHIKKVHVEVDYEVPPQGVRPNDLHLRIRKVSPFNGHWQHIVDRTIDPAEAWPIHLHFDKPDEEGAWDIRIIFTMDGRELDDGIRTGQFFVD